MTTLADFGHGTMQAGGATAAKGERPLLAILANVAGPQGSMAHAASWYAERLFGSPFAFDHAGNALDEPNLVDWYREMSCDRFTWKPAEPKVVGPITLSASDAALDLGRRRPKIVQLARDGGLVDFRRYDLSQDCTITSSELGVIIIDNGSDLGAQTDASSPALTLACASTAGSGMLGTLVVGHRFSMTLVAHELVHILGGHDVYGPWQPMLNLNGSVSLMSASEGQNDGRAVWHLDAWHKMRLGWSEPRLYDITQRCPPIELVAPGVKDPTGAAILYSPARMPREYFVIEYRNPKARGRYDRDVASTGIAIWHVVVDPPGFEPRQWIWPVTDNPANMIWLEGVAPAAGPQRRFGQIYGDFERGGNTLWDGGRITPPLRWVDDTFAGFRLAVRSIGAGADRAIVDVLPFPAPASSGRLLQGTWGAQGNYELLTTRGASVAHAWRDNDDPSFAWRAAGELPVAPPGGVAPQDVRGVGIVQATPRGTGSPGDFEAVLWLAAPDGTTHLALARFDAVQRRWDAPLPIVVQGVRITGATGVPAMIRSDYGEYGNTELLVPEGGSLVHYWRANDDPGRPWQRGATIAFTPAPSGGGSSIARRPVGVALLQSTIRGDGVHGNYEAVAWVRHALDQGSGALEAIMFDTGTRQWSTPGPVLVDGRPLDGVTGVPALIQSTFGSVGNFEMLVPQGTRLAHYWRNNDVAARPWHKSHVFEFGGHADTGPTGAMARRPVSVSMLRSSIRGDGTHGNFDAVVRLHAAATDDDALVFVAFNTATLQWTPARPLLVDGQPATER